MNISFTLNGQLMDMKADPTRRVLDLLREDMGLTAAKEGCGAGECGACAILVDGVPRLSCLMFAAQLQGRTIVTAEGLGSSEAPHPVQEALAERGGVQCGFCTPGVSVSAAALLAENAGPSRNEIRNALSGHLCRCTGYVKIVDAVEAAAEAMREEKP